MSRLASGMDITRLRRWGFIVAGAAVVLGLGLYGALAVLGDDDPSDQATSALRTEGAPATSSSTPTSTSISRPGSPGSTPDTVARFPAGSGASAGSSRAPGSDNAGSPESLGAAAGAAAARAADASDEVPPAGTDGSPTGTQPDGSPAGPTGAVPPGGSDPPSGGTDPPGSDGSTPPEDVYNSERCVVFRQLLGLIDSPEAEAAAASAGCI